MSRGFVGHVVFIRCRDHALFSRNYEVAPHHKGGNFQHNTGNDDQRREGQQRPPIAGANGPSTQLADQLDL